MVKIKRVYEEVEKSDGFRVLVDRLWPRGLSKGSGSIDLWCKEVAPSTELRKWFGHDPKKWDGFRKKYIAELKGNKEAFDELKAVARRERAVTLLYAAKDEAHNQAVVLQEVLKT